MPCLLSNYTNEQAAQIALIENTSREGLNPIAEALAMQRLSSEFRYTHEEIGTLLGISRTQVTNLLRLLNLDARIQHWMKQGELSEGHGKLLASLPIDKQYWYAYEAIKKDWSISVLDMAIKSSGNKKAAAAKKSNSSTTSFDSRLSEQLGYPIKVTLNKNETGFFRIPFHDREHMHKILDKLGCAKEILSDEMSNPDIK